MNCLLTDPEKKIDITSDVPLLANDPLLSILIQGMDVFNSAVPVNTLLWDRTQATPPVTYLYRIVLKDTRRWIQTVVFDVGQTEPTLTFNVSDPWKMSEFALQRSVRDALVLNSLTLGIGKVKIDYN